MMPKNAATPGTDRLSSMDWFTGSDSTSVAAREMPATAGDTRGDGGGGVAGGRTERLGGGWFISSNPDRHMLGTLAVSFSGMTSRCHTRRITLPQ